MKEIRNTKNSGFHRAIILSLIKEQGPKTISELSKYIKVTRPTVYGHLETLERRGLIVREKDSGKKGSPVTIKLTKKASPVSLKVLETAKKTWDNVVDL